MRDVPSRVIEFLAHRITSNVRELESARSRVLAYSNLVGRSISLEMTREVLKDLPLVPSILIIVEASAGRCRRPSDR
jgi:chromosomal replication initiation ATPase DnaA